MDIHSIETNQDYIDLQNYVRERLYTIGKIESKNNVCTLQFEDHELFRIELSNFDMSMRNKIYEWTKQIGSHSSQSQSNVSNEDHLIFGKDNTQNIVSVEAKDNILEIFQEVNGAVTSELRDNKFYILSHTQLDRKWTKLDGDLHYKYIKYYSTRASYYADKAKHKHDDIWSVSDPKESAMILQGITYFKGMKVSDVSILHWDIESTGLEHNSSSRVLLISTTYKSQGRVIKKLFAVDEYPSDKDMIEAFCEHVRTLNPSIVSGFNCFGFDLPYLQHVAKMVGAKLSLGRDESELRFDKYPSKFRKDGSQDYEYFRSWIYGREIVDMMHVAVHFDFSRKYESYGLKKIIAHEGLETPGRQFYDASQISKNWDNPEEKLKIKQYCREDSDDNDKLYQLMISAYFYFCRSIPKSFQQLNFSATGSQLNSLLLRSYIQEGHSIPKSDEVVPFPGAISEGYPGLYSNVIKFDVASLYPSVMLQYEIYDKDKDPKAHFLKMVNYFTKERLENKKKGKQTGDRYYKDLEQSQKIGCNSSYGLLGMFGNFNSPKNAALVTEYGRNVLKKSILWATGSNYIEKLKNNEEIDN